MIVLGQSGSISAKVFVLGQKLLYSGKNGSVPTKVVSFGQVGCNQANWFFLGKKVVFGQKWLYSG